MLLLYALLCFLLGAAFFLGMPALWTWARSRQLRDSRTILCPETLSPAEISIDPVLAARSEFAGRAQLQLASCSRWPARRDCDQACLPQFALVGDDRRLTRYAPFALHPSFLRVNHPMRMTPALYARISRQIGGTHGTHESNS